MVIAFFLVDLRRNRSVRSLPLDLMANNCSITDQTCAKDLQ